MATVTKTFTENQESTYKSTWTISVTQSNLTIGSSSTFKRTAPTVKAKYVYSGKTKGEVELNINQSIPSAIVLGCYYHRTYGSMVSGTTYSIPSSSTVTSYVSSVFNSSNPTTKTVNITGSISSIWLYSDTVSGGESVKFNSYESMSTISLGTIGTVTLDAPPTFTESVLSKDTDDYYTGITTVSVTISNASAQYGGNISSSKLTIGNQSVSGNGNGTLSMTLANAGTFTPTVSVTDSRGQVTTKNLEPITVNPYVVPSVSFDIFRSNSLGVKNDEGMYGLIIATLEYTDAFADLVAPEVFINGTITNNVTWYASYSEQSGVSSVITDWSSIASGAKVYGLVNGSFSGTTSYLITMIAKDDYGGTSPPITRTLSTGFYTIDFQSKEIVFGGPAKDDLTNFRGNDYSEEGLFKCSMHTLFEQDINTDGKIVTPQIQGGITAPTSVGANSYTDVTVNFSPAMSATPIVTCSLYSTSTAGAIGSLSVAVYSVSQSSVTFRIFNAGSSGRQPGVYWIAMNI